MDILVNNGLNINSKNATLGALAGDGSLNLGSQALTAGGNGASTNYSGLISGSGSLTKKGAGNLILTAANTYAGGTTITAGTVQIGNGGATGGIAGNVTNNGALAFNHSIDLTFGGVISGGGSLIKDGAEFLFLSGANTYTGGTVVNAGALKVLSSGTIGSGPLQVNSGARFIGSGPIGGEVTIESGGTVEPSGVTTLGTMTVNADFNLAGTYKCELDGGSSDQLKVSGDLEFTGAGTIQLQGSNISSDLYVIATYGTLTGTTPTVSNLPADYTLITSLPVDFAAANGLEVNSIVLCRNISPAYCSWALARGLTPSVNDGTEDDPNNDGRTNLEHFAFDTDPLGNGGNEGKRRLTVEDVGGTDYLTYTLPVRNGTTFSGDPLTSGAVDGIIYAIFGDTDLQNPWDLAVTELVPALDAGLPALGDYDGVAGADWEYRSFRLTDSISALQRGFMRAGVTPAP